MKKTASPVSEEFSQQVNAMFQKKSNRVVTLAPRRMLGATYDKKVRVGLGDSAILSFVYQQKSVTCCHEEINLALKCEAVAYSDAGVYCRILWVDCVSCELKQTKSGFNIVPTF